MHEDSTHGSVDSILSSAQAKILVDTGSPAFKELNVMSAPIHELPIGTLGVDSIRWTLQSDICGFVVVARRVVGGSEPRDVAALVAEWFGSAQFGTVWDIEPAPDWKWIAYGQARQIAAERDLDSVAVQTGSSREQLRTQLIRSTTGENWLAIPVIEPLFDTCSGDECPLDAAEPALGGLRVGWNRSGTSALVAEPENPPHGTTPRSGCGRSSRTGES
jgi:hypothetical protein